jgi:hypothetical protein
MLSSHPEVHAESEILLMLTLQQEHFARKRQLPCAHCLRGNGHPYPHSGREAEQAVHEFLLGAARASAEVRLQSQGGRVAAAGFKLLNGQAGIDLSEGAWDPEGFLRRDAALTEAFISFLERERCRIILLERQGLGKEVSTAMHDHRIRSNSNPNGTAWCSDASCAKHAQTSGEKVWIDAGRLKKRLDNSVSYWSQLLKSVRSRFFSRMLYVTYEDLESEPHFHMRRILRFLGANESRRFSVSATQKMGAPRVSTQIENAAQVEAALEGTQWELQQGW